MDEFAVDPVVARSLGELAVRDPGFGAALRSARETLGTFQGKGLISRADIEGKRILDWECGAGAFSALFLAYGAASVTAIDSWLDEERARGLLGGIPRLSLAGIDIEAFASGAGEPAFDLVFANTVTEQLAALPAAFARCNRVLASRGKLLLNHDNYYQPVGSHDHGFLFYGNQGRVEFQGVRCWEAREKCAASDAHRKDVAARFPWTWDEVMNRRLSPEDCTRCPYYLRGQPWAHLSNQEAFRWLYPQPGFSTGYPKSSLNKITPFQLRQYLVEAGFDVESWVPHRIANEVPPPLLQPPFNFVADELKSTTIAVKCTRGSPPPYAG